MPRGDLGSILLAGGLALCAGAAVAQQRPATPLRAGAGDAASADVRADEIERRMRPEERTVLTHGLWAIPLIPKIRIPSDAVLGAGYIAGIPRLGVPALRETDASLGVSYIANLRNDGATAMPSATAMGSTWNLDLIRRGGALIASEARAKGFNVLLGGGINLMRDPRNGRTFEYFGEDPLHSGLLGGAAIEGTQSQHVMSTVKHFALNAQETGRHAVDGRIADDAFRMSDLLAFELAIERGQPGSVMCAYNRVNGAPACGSDYLLNRVLKADWRYSGFVMSDWGAVDAVEFALAGLDQQSGAQIDKQIFFAKPLADAAARDPAYATRLADMNRRILRSIYAVGLDAYPPVKAPIDFAVNGAVARAVADQSIVLLRNRGGLLPLSKDVRSIVVIGGYADAGVLSGGGSTQVQPEGGPSVSLPMGGEGLLAKYNNQTYHGTAPLAAIRALAPKAKVTFVDGRYPAEAAAQAKAADVAIVFATQWMAEGSDVPDLSLPGGQDTLIAAVAAANPKSIVVLETGGPVLMPWLDRTGAVLEAWYGGVRGGDAIAATLFGDVNPSGRLPVTFPAAVDQLPRPALPYAGMIDREFAAGLAAGKSYPIDYDIEGADVGYRWFARKSLTPLFPFGFGLSYTRFDHGPVRIAGGAQPRASVTVRNAGARAGSEVVQLYLVSTPAGATRRLAGFAKLAVEPGATATATIPIEPRVVAQSRDGRWTMPAGRYGFALGRSATDLGPTVTITLPARQWR
ncbi:beta-glucosidase [Sphingomonas ginsenosidimutans]|uniref:beta-glucosidase n=2 Tax=Sphingomonas TaxID=13687 RepID=UPI0008778915|nr:glycoside hydrolase family 3 C-terminal domain-containing protein [Sphingomonas ginsenosidimutans]MBY0301133.1 glycoside hydrolase family 3 C-terminal domain-containing protein [Sphingomonas ginsenosidimutans]